MKLSELKSIIVESVMILLNEGWYDTTATPLHSKTDRYINMGINPLTVDNGGHSSNDIVRQASTIDYNGSNFDGESVILSDNKFMIYKIKNFGNENLKGTLNFFNSKNRADGERKLRQAIDTVFGAARRNGKGVMFRFIAPETARKPKSPSESFCEYSYDGGNVWYILLPNPTMTMKVSKLVRKV